jgi:hypothetical protein
MPGSLYVSRRAAVQSETDERTQKPLNFEKGADLDTITQEININVTGTVSCPLCLGLLGLTVTRSTSARSLSLTSNKNRTRVFKT